MMDDREHSDARTAIGPQAASDSRAGFKRRMRLHQSWYRHEVLGVPCGTGPFPSSRSYYGNMLDAESARKGLNFLSPRIHSLAERRIAEGVGTVDVFRLRRNMLSSQPMCFNLFGELALDLELATVLGRSLWGDHVRKVTAVRFEWAPARRAEYLNDGTAFDAFIEYEASDGKRGFIGIETKLTEPFSQRKRYRREEYMKWMAKPNAPWHDGSTDEVSRLSHNQLWRDHLLAWALLAHPESDYAHGRFVVVFHGDDAHTNRVVAGYRRLLRDEATFQPLELGEIVSAWRPHAGDWLAEFERRYVDLSGSDRLAFDQTT